jgi:hypothetical protein
VPYNGKQHSKVKHLTPKAKLALKALAMGAATTNTQAGAIADLHPAYVGVLKSTQVGAQYMAGLEGKIDEKLMDEMKLMQLLGREALLKMGGLMRFSNDENIILRASADLLDRNPVTQKVHKAQVESFSVSSEDAREIAAAMVEAARERQRYAEAASGNFVKIADIPAPGADEDVAA